MSDDQPLTGVTVSMPDSRSEWDLEVVDVDLQPVAHSVLVDRDIPLALPAGDYFVRLRSSDGRQISRQVTLSSDFEKVVLDPDREKETGEGDSPLGWGPRLGRPVSSEPLFEPWYEAYEFLDGDWRPATVTVKASGMNEWRIDAPHDQVTTLHLGAKELPSRFLVLPPGQSKLTWHHRQSTSHLDGGWRHELETDDRSANALFRFVAEGLSGPAARIADELQAEKILQQKMANPVRAALGGYFLLRLGAWDRLHDWPANLASWFSWLPDGAVIYGTQLLREPGARRGPAVEAGIGQLLLASQRGLPLYTEGLRLLYEGLRISSRADAVGEGIRQQVRKELERVEAYAAAANWQQPYTTFYGARPSLPSLEPNVSGRPEGAKAVV